MSSMRWFAPVVCVLTLLAFDGARIASADEESAPAPAAKDTADAADSKPARKAAKDSISPLPANWAKLNLSDEQKEKIRGVIGKSRKDLDALEKQIDELSDQLSKLRKHAAALREASMKEALAVLTPEQLENLEKIENEAIKAKQEERRARRSGRTRTETESPTSEPSEKSEK